VISALVHECVSTRAACNRADVRERLRLREPRFAAQLDYAVRALTCIHPGLFAAYPPNATEHCWYCNQDVPYTEL
jgi:hypothetical protein